MGLNEFGNIWNAGPERGHQCIIQGNDLVSDDDVISWNKKEVRGMEDGTGIASSVQGVASTSVQDCLFILFCICIETTLCAFTKGDSVTGSSCTDLLLRPYYSFADTFHFVGTHAFNKSQLCLSLHDTVLTKLCCIKTIKIRALCIVTYSFFLVAKGEMMEAFLEV